MSPNSTSAYRPSAFGCQNRLRASARAVRAAKKRTGAVTVELALTAGLAFMFFFASLEFCRVSMIRHTTEHALYEGARRGIVPGATATEVQSEVQSVLRTIGISGATISVTPSTITNSTRDITVRVQLPLDRGLFAPALFFQGKVLDKSIVMQREGVR